MRRTAPFLLAAALLVTAGPAASADPAAEVGPGSVPPGGSVTVSVSCDPLGGTAPETLDAVSQAFADGTVRLSRVAGDDGGLTGPAYQGTAHIAADLDEGLDGAGPDSAWTVDGTCPAPPGGQGRPWSASFDVAHGADSGGGVQPCASAQGWSCESTGHACPRPQQTHGAAPHTTGPHAAAPHDDSCAPATVEHGVQAGEGGAFTGSVPALVAGGLLIAGAFGATVHRLRRRNSGADA